VHVPLLPKKLMLKDTLVGLVKDGTKTSKSFSKAVIRLTRVWGPVSAAGKWTCAASKREGIV